MSDVFAFECNVSGKEWHQAINARSAGKAKAEYHHSVMDAWPDIPYTAVRARKIGAAQSSKDFIRNAEYRGFPDARCGQRVSVHGDKGVIVGHNSSANFDILFDDDAPKYAGLTLNVHPQEITFEAAK